MGSTWDVHRCDALRWLMEYDGPLFDALITDPPYSSGGLHIGSRTQTTDKKYTQGGVGTFGQRPDFEGDNRDQRSFLVWMSLWLQEAKRVLRPGAPVLLFSDWRQSSLMSDALQCGGMVYRGKVIWDKTEAVRHNPGFASQHEEVLWGTNGVNGANEHQIYLAGVYRFPVKQHDKHHQTGKPTALMRELVKICPPGGLVLDPFAGSGTTGVAALLEGRQFVGLEITDAYHEIASRRLLEVAAALSGTHETAPLFASVAAADSSG